MSDIVNFPAYVGLLVIALTLKPLMQDLSGNVLAGYAEKWARDMYCNLSWEPCESSPPPYEAVPLEVAIRTPDWAVKLAYVRHSGAAALNLIKEIGSNITSTWTSAMNRFNHLKDSLVQSLNDRLLSEETKEPWYSRMSRYLHRRFDVHEEQENCHQLTEMFKGRCISQVFIKDEIANRDVLYSFSPSHRALYLIMRKVLIALAPYIIQLCVFGPPSLAIFLTFKRAFKKSPKKESIVDNVGKGKGDYRATDREQVPTRSRFPIAFIVLIVAAILAISSGFLIQEYGTPGVLLSSVSFVSGSEDVIADADHTWLSFPFSYLYRMIRETYSLGKGNKPISALDSPTCSSALAFFRFECLRDTLFVMEERHAETDLAHLSPLQRSAYLKVKRHVIDAATIVVISMELATIAAALYFGENCNISESKWEKKCYELIEDVSNLRKKVKSLEMYLGDLPTADEVNCLKANLKHTEESKKLLISKLRNCQDDLLECRNIIGAKDTYIIFLEDSSKENRLHLEFMQNQLDTVKQNKTEVDTSDQSVTLSATLQQVKYLENEVAQANKLVTNKQQELQVLEKHHNEVLKEYESRISYDEDETFALKSQITTKEKCFRNLLHEAAADKQNLLAEKLFLKEEISKLYNNCKEYKEQDSLLQNLFQEIMMCFSDLKGLIEAFAQCVSGNSPDISLLLGVQSMISISLSEVKLHSSTLQEQLDEAHSVREKIIELRSILVEKCISKMVDCMISTD